MLIESSHLVGGAIVIPRGTLNLDAGLIPQPGKHGRIQRGHDKIVGRTSQGLDRGDPSGAQLAALVLAHASHQDQIALGFESLLDAGLPQAVITWRVFRFLR